MGKEKGVVGVDFIVGPHRGNLWLICFFVYFFATDWHGFPRINKER
jgi:hypothetical protein